MVHNNCGDDYSTVIPDVGYLCVTVITEKVVFMSNNIPTVIDSVLLSLNIGGTKDKIYLSKTDTATNLTIHKMTEIIESNGAMYVTDDKGLT